MAEYIEREAVMQKFADHVRRSNNSDFAPAPTWNEAVQIVEDFPAADVRPVVRGKWEQKEVFEAKGHVDELQSAFCPVCQRYHTTPYSYYFTNYNFCPNCGADMRAEDGE